MGLLGICADEDTDGQEAEDEQRARKPASKPKSSPPVKAAAEFWATARVIMSASLTDKAEQEAAVRAIYVECGAADTADMLQLKLGGAVLKRLRNLYEPPPE